MTIVHYTVLTTIFVLQYYSDFATATFDIPALSPIFGSLLSLLSVLYMYIFICIFKFHFRYFIWFLFCDFFFFYWWWCIYIIIYIGGGVCEESVCGRGECVPLDNTTIGFACECEPGWRQALPQYDEYPRFLPCVIPNCKFCLSTIFSCYLLLDLVYLWKSEWNFQFLRISFKKKKKKNRLWRWFFNLDFWFFIYLFIFLKIFKSK